MFNPPAALPTGPRRLWLVWAVVLFLLAAYHLVGATLIVRAVIAPEARTGRHGWLVERFAGKEMSSPALAQEFIPSHRRVEIQEEDHSLTAYSVWEVAKTGPYGLTLLCDDSGSLYVDGKPVVSLEGISPDNRGQAAVELSAGPHLLRVDLYNGPGKGFFSVLAQGPDQTAPAFLEGAELAYPDLGNIHGWWRGLELSLDARLLAFLALALGLVMIAVPLATTGGLKALTAVCLLIVLPALFLPGPPPKFPFQGRLTIQALQAQKPDYVILGNSMADNSIDDGRLEELTGGRVMMLTMGGTRSAVRFLMFKNLLVASGERPKATFIFFRDNYLTNPLLRTRGLNNQNLLESLCPGEEPLVEELVHGRRSLIQRLAGGVQGLFPVLRYQPAMKNIMSDLVLALVIPGDSLGQTGKRRAQVKAQVNERFKLDRLRGSADEAALDMEGEKEDPAYDPDLYLDFDRVAESSFLPHFIRLAKEHGLKLVFIRVQRRPTEHGPPPQSPQMKAYTARLGQYLAAQGVEFHDFTGDPELPLSMYGAGDHIANDKAARFTEIFYRRLAQVF